MLRKLVVKNKETFQTPQYDFFEGMEVIENPYVPDNCFMVFEGNTFMNTTMYIFKYKNGELYYHKIPPMWNIDLPLVKDPYEKNKFHSTITQQLKISKMVLPSDAINNKGEIWI